jgi:hypothetical protein
MSTSGPAMRVEEESSDDLLRSAKKVLLLPSTFFSADSGYAGEGFSIQRMSPV